MNEMKYSVGLVSQLNILCDCGEETERRRVREEDRHQGVGEVERVTQTDSVSLQLLRLSALLSASPPLCAVMDCGK